MRTYFPIGFTLVFFFGCKSYNNTSTDAAKTKAPSNVFVVALGSCNKQYEENPFWDDVLAEHPDVWIWGGDNIYASVGFTVEGMKKGYRQQNKNRGYRELKSQVPVIGTWDDHDYGLNDGGAAFPKKKETQQLFLDFMDVPKNSARRDQEGIYTSHLFGTDHGKVKVLVLDTRYFRSPLEKDENPNRRYKVNNNPNATVLGPAQWNWLQKELETSDAAFNLIVTSIQFLSSEHGFETWGNFPGEVEKLKKTIINSGAKGVMVLSGDRHISEFSKINLEGLNYPLIDFTSSGLTHSYSDFKSEPNWFRISDVTTVPSFGIIVLDLDSKEAHFKIMGENDRVYQELKQRY